MLCQWRRIRNKIFSLKTCMIFTLLYFLLRESSESTGSLARVPSHRHKKNKHHKKKKKSRKESKFERLEDAVERHQELRLEGEEPIYTDDDIADGHVLDNPMNNFQPIVGGQLDPEIRKRIEAAQAELRKEMPEEIVKSSRDEMVDEGIEEEETTTTTTTTTTTSRTTEKQETTTSEKDDTTTTENDDTTTMENEENEKELENVEYEKKRRKKQQLQPQLKNKPQQL